MADIERKVAKKIYDAIDGDYTLISRLVSHIEDVADKSGLQMHQTIVTGKHFLRS